MTEADLEAAGWQRHPTDVRLYPFRDPISRLWFGTEAALHELQRRADGRPEFGPDGRIPPAGALPEVPASWSAEAPEGRRRGSVPYPAT